MKRIAIAVTSIAAATVMLASAASAQADERVIARPLSAYLNPNVSIDRGEALTFWNLDFTAPHDVTSVKTRNRCVKRYRKGPRKGECRKRVQERLFASETIEFPAEVPVKGAQKLRPGSYAYFCTIHPFMKGTLRVN